MANKPNIRFKGFTDDWEQRKLGEDLESIQTGTNLLGSENNNGMPLLKMGNIQRGYFDTSKLEYLVDNKSVEPENVAYYGDFFFNTRNTMELVGKGATWTGESGKYAFNSNIARFKLKGIDTIFFNFLYNTDSMAKQVHARAMGTTSVAAIYPRSLDSIDYCLPCIDEQKRIGDYFRNLDHLITLHQRKCDETKKLKKFMLQKMFPKNGEKNPEIRFAGFTDDWEQRKLGECAIFNPKSELPDIFEYVDLESVVGTNILCHRTENKSSAPLRAQRLAQKKDVFYQTVRPYQMNNCIFENDEDNWVFSTGYAQLRPYNDSYFLLTLLQNDDFVKQVLDRCTGTSYPAINSNDLADIDVSIPLNENEQKKIGGHFRNLDHLITLHQRKCDKLKLIKKFKLQNMFPKKG